MTRYITSDTNEDVEIAPNGTGDTVINGLTYPKTDGTNGQVIGTDGSGNLGFITAGGGGGGASNVKVTILENPTTTFTPDINCLFAHIKMCGGGASAGGLQINSNPPAVRAGSPGGAGNYLEFYMTKAQMGSSVVCSVGLRSTTFSDGNGNNGQNTTFADWIATGGTGGLFNNSSNSIRTVNTSSNTVGTGQLITNFEGMGWESNIFILGSTGVSYTSNPCPTNPLSYPGTTLSRTILDITGNSTVNTISTGSNIDSVGYGRGAAARLIYIGNNSMSSPPYNVQGLPGRSNGVIIVTEYLS